MNQIEAVNICLRLSGIVTVNQVTAGDDKANIALEILVDVRREVLSQAYRFNTRQLDLQVDASNKVPVPKSYLRVTFPDANLTEQDDGTGNLFVWHLGDNAWHAKEILNAIITFDVAAYECIPEAFARWIAYKAANEFFFRIHQTNSPFIERRAMKMRAKALNTMPPLDIHKSTKFATVNAARAR